MANGKWIGYDTQCGYCGVNFVVRKDRYLERIKQDENPKFYCGNKCRGDAQKKGDNCNCIECGAVFYKKKSASKHVYCSTKCRALSEANKTKVEKNCAACGKPFTLKSRNKTTIFCSKRCFNSIPRREGTGEKISAGVLRFSNEKHKNDPDFVSISKFSKTTKCCARCGELFSPNYRYAKYCSKICMGWPKSKDLNGLSFPEHFTILILSDIIGSLDLDYIREYKVGKFYIDFAFQKQRFALEIDGRQHEFPNIRDRDKKRDEFLKENGWNVIRVKCYLARDAKLTKGNLKKRDEFIHNIEEAIIQGTGKIPSFRIYNQGDIK